jgi:hypothetical protein
VDHDLVRLRDLLDDGHDTEDDNGDGWTLLRCAIHAERARHAATGAPLHVDTTAYLLARGADPTRRNPAGTSAVTEARQAGHWLAAEIMRSWVSQDRPAVAQNND